MFSPGECFKTKAIKYNDGDEMDIGLILTRFDGEHNDALSSEGWRGQYLMVTNVSGGRVESSTTPRNFANEVTAANDDALKEFLLAIETGEIPFGVIKDGMTYRPSSIYEIMDRYGVDERY